MIIHSAENEEVKMSKIELDKYYTSPKLAKYCFDKAIEVIGSDNITTYIEPSAGAGVFIDLFDKPYTAYDIESDDPRIIIQDYLTTGYEYTQGCLVIGNPPYGNKSALVKKFYSQAIYHGDYIAFILPISQLNNSQGLYQFDLIYSEDLGEQDYSGHLLRCCFNIYRRPEQGFNKKPKTDLCSVDIFRNDYYGYQDLCDYDIRMCVWGGKAGEILTASDKQYAGECKIYIRNSFLYEEIYKCIVETDWQSIINNITMRKLQKHHIIRVLQEKIKGID